ncbi:MAG: type 1 glutamine amidotransferase [bacterium]
MRRILILLHVGSEGPGTLGDFLGDRPVRMEEVRLFAGERIPAGLGDLTAVISMGGPMNVYEEQRFPFLRHETEFLARVIDQGVPVLGVCLGAQLIARACGARVVRSPVREVGWYDIALTEAGRGDRLFDGLPESLHVFQWHEDMIEVPAGGQVLAASQGCPHQAFRCANAYGLQFHVEVTGQMLAGWFAGDPQAPGMLRHLELKERELAALSTRLYDNFWSHILTCARETS